MSFRLRKSIKLAPGVKLNLGAKSGSVTIGGRGASVNVGSRRSHVNLGIPGTGISYRLASSTSSTASSRITNMSPANNANPAEKKIVLELFDDGNIVFKDASGNLLPDELIHMVKLQNKAMIIEWLEKQCTDFNQGVKSLLNLHLFTLPPDTEIKFTPARFSATPPIAPSAEFSVPPPELPTLKEHNLLSKKVGFLGQRIDSQNEQLRITYEAQLQEWETARGVFQLDYEAKYQEYTTQYSECQKLKAEFDEQQERQRRLVEEERLTDTTAMQAFLAEALQDIVWPRETTVSFDIRDEGKVVILDVDLPEIEDMPTQVASVSKRDMKLIIAERSKTQRQKDYLTHIYAIGFRLIGEVFVSLPTVETVVLSATAKFHLHAFRKVKCCLA
jgi:hypothetical protein